MALQYLLIINQENLLQRNLKVATKVYNKHCLIEFQEEDYWYAQRQTQLHWNPHTLQHHQSQIWQNVQQNNLNWQNSKHLNQQWTSKLRDSSHRLQNFPNMQQSFGDSVIDTSLLNVIDTQHQVQHETTQALSKAIQLQDTWSNDTFQVGLPTFQEAQ